MFDPNAPMADLQTQTQQLEQQRQMADMLRQRAAQSQQPQGQMVGGRFIAPNILQHLKPLLDQYQARMATDSANQQATGLTQATQKAAENWQSQLPRATAAIPGNPGMGGNEMGDEPVAPVAPQPAQMPDRGSVLKATLAGLQIPGNANAAMLWNKAMGEDITREDNQLDKRETRAETLLSQRRIATEKALERADEAKRRSEDTRLSVEQRREAATLAAEARKYAADSMKAIASMRIAAGPAEKPAKPLPSNQANAWVGNNTGIRNIDEAIKLVEANPSAFGVKNYLGDAIVQRMDPKGVEARAKVADIGGQKVHERSGAAVSVSEDRRLSPYTPNAKDEAPALLKKLKQLRSAYQNNNQEINDFAESMGYRVPSTPGGNDKPNAPEAPKAPAGLVLPPGAKYIGPAQ